MKAALTVSTAALLAAAAAGYVCKTAADCEYLGACNAGACACAPGFTGPSCGVLDLAPASAAGDDLPAWPRSTANANASAWGFTVAHDPSDGLWHAYATVACGADGVLGPVGGESWVAHLTSPRPDGGFTLAGMVVPQTSFGPHVASPPAGVTGVPAYLLVFRVNAFAANATLCAGNGTDPLPAGFRDGALIPYDAIAPGDPEKGTNMFVAGAPSMSGPWTVVRLNVSGAGDAHKSNPSITVLNDGRVLLAYRYNSPKGELNAFAFAAGNAWDAPSYVSAFNLTNGALGDEDPFVWQQPDGTLHAIWHNKGAGYHAFATDNGGRGGYHWAVSPVAGTHAFSLDVPLANGTTITLKRRERPEIRFNPADGSPATLYTGAYDAQGRAYALAQPFATAVAKAA